MMALWAKAIHMIESKATLLSFFGIKVLATDGQEIKNKN
jgi:hypothetical protein